MGFFDMVHSIKKFDYEKYKKKTEEIKNRGDNE